MPRKSLKRKFRKNRTLKRKFRKNRRRKTNKRRSRRNLKKKRNLLKKSRRRNVRRQIGGASQFAILQMLPDQDGWRLLESAGHCLLRNTLQEAEKKIESKSNYHALIVKFEKNANDEVTLDESIGEAAAATVLSRERTNKDGNPIRTPPLEVIVEKIEQKLADDAAAASTN